MPLGFETNNGPIRFDHERVELIKGIDTPNGKAHFVVARETPINADMRGSRQWQSVVEVHFFSAPSTTERTNFFGFEIKLEMGRAPRARGSIAALPFTRRNKRGRQLSGLIRYGAYMCRSPNGTNKSSSRIVQVLRRQDGGRLN